MGTWVRRRPSAPSWVSRLVALRYPLLLLAAIVSALVGLREHGDWDVFFRPAVNVLLDRTDTPPLSLYAASPATQIGPLALILAIPLALLGAASGMAAEVVIALAWLLIVALGERLANELRPDRTQAHAGVALVGGAFGSILWHSMAYYRHLDDAVVVTAAAAAAVLVSRARPVGVGVALGMAAAAKPWGVGALPLVLALPRARDRVVAGLGAGVIVSASWLPFVLGDRMTISSLAGFRLNVQGGSTLTLIGVEAGAPMPGWTRLAQFMLALCLGALAVHRGHWTAVPLIMVVSRLAMESTSWPYYYAGLVGGALLWDFGRRARLLPTWTVAVVFLQYDLRWLLNSPRATAWLNALLLLATMLSVCQSRISLQLSKSARSLSVQAQEPAAPTGRSPVRSR